MGFVITVLGLLSGAITKLWAKSVTDAKEQRDALIAENVALKLDMNTRIAAAEAKIERQEKEVQDCHKEKEQVRVELAAVKTRLEILESRVV